MDANTYTRIKSMKAQGLTYRAIADATGEDYNRVINVCLGRIKQPGQARADAGRSRYNGIEDLVAAAKVFYMQQGRKVGNLTACIDMALDAGIQQGTFVPRTTLRRHVDARFHAERWDILWESRKQQHGFQARLPKMAYDTWNLVGYNDYWVIDGRKSDMWVLDPASGKTFMPQGFYVMELKTAKYLGVSMSRRAHSAREVIMLLLFLALKHGPPNLGILCDNGSEQIGMDNIDVMELFWDRLIIESYRIGHGIAGFHDIYPGAISPVVTSLPRIPTEFAKARLERSFRFMQSRFDALVAGTAYQGGNRDDVVHTTLMRSPKLDRSWITFDDFTRYMDWFLTAPPEDRQGGILPYSAIERPHMLSTFAKETGMLPTVGNAAAYCEAGYLPSRIPDANFWGIVYHACPRFDARRVRRAGLVEFDAKGTHYAFASACIPFTMVGRKLDVVLDPQDDTRAGLFDSDTREFLGTAEDISRRVNTRRISIADGKEQMGKLRQHVRASVHAESDQFAISPPRPALTTSVPEPVRVLEIAPVQDQLRLIDQYNSRDDDDAAAEMSDETRDLLSRTYSNPNV